MFSAVSVTLASLRAFAFEETRRASVTPATIDLSIRAGHAQTILAVAVGACLAAGAGVALVSLLTGADQLLGFKRLLDLNGEGNLPTWFSSGLLLVAALLLGGLAISAAPAQRRAWALLAVVFAGLSLDEAASLHEMSNAPLRRILQLGPALYFPWVIGGALIAALVGMSEWRLLRSLPRRTAVRFTIAGIVFVTGAIGLEALAAPLYATRAHPLAHTALITAEEFFEMLGVSLFIMAVAGHWVETANTVALRCEDRAASGSRVALLEASPRRVFRWMLATALTLAAVNLALQAVHFFTPLKMTALVRLFNLAREGNVPTWYQSATLLLCAGLAAVVAVRAWRDRAPFRVHWALTALFCLYLSADEAASIHEMSVRPLRAAFDTTGLLYYPWIAIGGAVALTLAVASRGFLAGLPARTRRTVVLAAAIFLAGALGIEALGGRYAELHGRANFAYGAIATAEETLEMIGVLIAVRALLEYIRDHIGSVRLRLVA
jgi:hypothetical protein